MEKINLNILGHKNFSNEQLGELLVEIDKIKIGYPSILIEPINDLKHKLRRELDKRGNRDWIWLEFTCSWSGYSNNPSAPKRDIDTHYRKIKKLDYEKIPKYYCHKFSDNSTNDWTIRIVDTQGTEKGTYAHQIDEFLKEYIK